jgi:hypothetical protein
MKAKAATDPSRIMARWATYLTLSIPRSFAAYRDESASSPEEELERTPVPRGIDMAHMYQYPLTFWGQSPVSHRSGHRPPGSGRRRAR